MIQRPVSAIPASDGLVGVLSLIVAWSVVMLLDLSPLPAAVLLLLATAAPMLARELRRSEPRPSLTAANPSSWLVGLVAASVPFALVHAQDAGLAVFSLGWFVVMPAFAVRWVVELRRNGQIEWGFPLALGSALLARDIQALRSLAPAARVWTLKAFFIPLYGAGLCFTFATAGGAAPSSLSEWLIVAVLFAFTVDLTFGIGGYVFASKGLGTDPRSTQRSWLGWAVCLACYAPIMHHWPAFKMMAVNEAVWPKLVTVSPVSILGAGLMLTLLALYISATIVFGLRFSNLSNRGVITSGPYRLMKHPAYFAHACNSWVITVLLLPSAGVTLSWQMLLVPAAFTLLYRLRAVTEERHMSESEEYVRYAEWIAEHGLLGRALRPLRQRKWLTPGMLS